jgi:hypothetical protein
MWRVLAALSGAALLLTGCAGAVDGTARPATGAGDPAAFFHGAVPTYGQRVSSYDRIRLAYLRALRRIDVCGLTDQDALARVGEISSVGTLFALDQCDVNVKVPGEVAPRYVSATVELAQPRGPEVLNAEGLPVREAYAGACEFLVPLDLGALPGASPLFGPEQPQLRVEMVAESDCGVVRRVTAVLAARVTRPPLPVRDGAAVYTTPLAERDPCEVLATLADDEIGYWNIPGSGPYRCEFGIARSTDDEAVPMALSLRPRVVDAGIDGRELIRSGDAEVYLDRESCSALVFVGPELRRRLSNGDLVDTGDVRIRPAIEVASEEMSCTGTTLVEQIAARAAALYR